VLILVPDKHASVDQVFTTHLNNSGFGSGMFWWYVLPLGFLLTQYTITGYDASAHISEETHGADGSAPKGVWRSVFYSAIIGYVVLLAITFAAADTGKVSEGGGSVFAVFENAMGTGWVEFVLIVAVIGQLFCGMSCMTSASRMMYAFSRDGAVPGWRIWSRVNAKRIPFNAVIAVAVLALILTLPALKGNKDGITVAFTAVVSIGVIGLYIAYVIPIFLRWRMGDSFVPGPWTLGSKYKWMCVVAIVEVIVVVIIYFNLPFSSSGVPWESDFEWSLFNYTPVVTFGVFAAVGIWWLASARHWFTGPRRTIDEIDAEIGPPPPFPESP
jgi:amino acid transporter